MKRRRRRSGCLQEAGLSQEPGPLRLQCEDSFWLLSFVVDASAWSCRASAGKFMGRVASVFENILGSGEVSISGCIHDFLEIALNSHRI